MGPVVIRADLVVPPVSAEGAAVCVYRCDNQLDDGVVRIAARAHWSKWPSHGYTAIHV